MEFHVSRRARDRYQFRETLFSFTGNVIFANLAASREFAHRMNQVRGAEQDPARTVHPGALYAMGLIDEVSHALVAIYRKQLDPGVMAEALNWFEDRLGRQALDKTLAVFVERFPTIDVYRGEISSPQWLQGETDGVPHRFMAFEEMMLLWLANANPAFKPFSELFRDHDMAEDTSYPRIAAGLREFFQTRPRIAPGNLNLIDLLRAPALASPDSLRGQLAFIREKWAPLIGGWIDRLILTLDILREEEIAIWMLFNPPSVARRRGRPGDFGNYAEPPSYAEAAQEYERYSPDQEWMPTTVLIAKSTYVWLEQLSRQYGRHIHRLDQIPREELALIARRGLNALWLIGIWERSRASQTIKQLCGNPVAVASAYSLYGYSIAEDLGGEAAYRSLRDSASACGIRLASDMVPNHMGIDSSWVIEHPEWFLSRPDSPYPAYSFEGPNLSYDGRVEIKIEDHYYNQTDAAVVFRRRDKWTGDTRYIYHGNDGTSFPWNDTAQLDYLNPATREQVIRTIVQVARLFPIIRFDAAMTLAKRHVQRLWYPLPGTGGALPSRAEMSMPQAQFNQAMPHEFWREVVDRVAREAPGTLLLAEAFWLMEGYFVRTLGMHRVYNSAFMIMLRDEDNAKYRTVIKNTLEFDPDILKRYVNFMSNPDERTAIDQFGRDDKYFGVATLMATLPGLPMFAHGQIEGFTEKYGMDFRHPRYDERPDRWLVERHEREIAPLLNRRWLFAESRNFVLYDFYCLDGTVDEDVFAFSNRCGDQRALVIYHNRYSATNGTIHQSAAYLDKAAGCLRRQTIGEAFSLPGEDDAVLAFRDTSTGLEHLARSKKIAASGFTIALRAYERHVFLDWRELKPDENARWDQLCDHLNGRGVSNLEEALCLLELVPVHDAFADLLSADLLQAAAELSNELDPVDPVNLADGGGETVRAKAEAAFLDLLETRGLRFFAAASERYSRKAHEAEEPDVAAAGMSREFCRLALAAIQVPLLEDTFHSLWPPEARAVLPSSSGPPIPVSAARTAVWGPVLAWCALEVFQSPQSLRQTIDKEAALGLGRHKAAPSPDAGALAVFDQLRLREPLARALDRAGVQGEDSWRAAGRVKVALLAQQGSGAGAEWIAGYPRQLWDDPDVRWLIDVHRAAPAGQALEQEFFNKELHEQLLWWIQLPELVTIAGEQRAALKTAKGTANAATAARRIADLESEMLEALAAAERAGYRTNELLASAAPR